MEKIYAGSPPQVRLGLPFSEPLEATRFKLAAYSIEKVETVTAEAPCGWRMGLPPPRQ
jgi:hypothetical protein